EVVHCGIGYRAHSLKKEMLSRARCFQMFVGRGVFTDSMTHLRTPSAFSKNRAADPYMGGAQLSRELEIGAHAHRERQNPVARGDLVQKREMRRGLIVDGRNAHQP